MSSPNTDQQVLNEISRLRPDLLKSTLQHLKNLLSAIFTHAIGQGILDGEVTSSDSRKTVYGNPMRSVRIPNSPEGEETTAYSLEAIVRVPGSPNGSSNPRARSCSEKNLKNNLTRADGAVTRSDAAQITITTHHTVAQVSPRLKLER